MNMDFWCKGFVLSNDSWDTSCDVVSAVIFALEVLGDGAFILTAVSCGWSKVELWVTTGAGVRFDPVYWSREENLSSSISAAGCWGTALTPERRPVLISKAGLLPSLILGKKSSSLLFRTRLWVELKELFLYRSSLSSARLKLSPFTERPLDRLCLRSALIGSSRCLLYRLFRGWISARLPMLSKACSKFSLLIRISLYGWKLVFIFWLKKGVSEFRKIGKHLQFEEVLVLKPTRVTSHCS